MAPITSLAEETLQLLFAHINSTKHLAQCRLVCKRFDPNAEKAMFNLPVVIHTEDQAFSLLQHLARCQRKGIAYFHWGLEPYTLPTPQVFRHLLPLILTSKTVSLTGCVEGDEFYFLIDDIVRQLPEKPNLISLPHTFEYQEYYYLFLRRFQDTIQSAHVHLMRGNAYNLDYVMVDVFGMPLLKSVFVKGDSLDMVQLVEWLPEQLEELELEFDHVDKIRDSSEMMHAWLTSNPPPSSNYMKKLTLKGDCPACQIECFMYMYPELESLTIDLRLPRRETHDGLEDHMDRILNCLGDVPQKELIITSLKGQLLKETVDYLKGKGLDISIASVQGELDIRIIVGGLNQLEQCSRSTS